ncbi:MAG: protein rep [Acidithiobacillus ferrivorans]
MTSSPPFFPDRRRSAARFERYELQGHARVVLGPLHRVRVCHRHRVPLQSVRVLSDRKTKHSHLAGLMACGLVWACPVCAAKVSERRRLELSGAMASAKSQAFVVLFETQTVPHARRDDLASLRSSLSAARRRLFKDRAGRSLASAFGLVGSVSALEVTHGSNGWHPHGHVLRFFDPSRVDWPSVCAFVRSSALSSPPAALFRRLDVLPPAGALYPPAYVEFASFASGSGSAPFLCPETLLYAWRFLNTPRWVASCVAEGLGAPDYEHGFHVQNGNFAAEYVAKWGIEPSGDVWGPDHEMTKAHLKKRSNPACGRSTWDLLRAVRDNGCSLSADLFREFVGAFHRAKQLTWSVGLRALLGVGVELSDDEVAALQPEQADVLCSLDVVQWAAVRRFSKQADLLDLSETNPAGLSAFLDDLVESARIDALRFAAVAEVETTHGLRHAITRKKSRVPFTAPPLRAPPDVHTPAYAALMRAKCAARRSPLQARLAAIPDG